MAVLAHAGAKIVEAQILAARRCTARAGLQKLGEVLDNRAVSCKVRMWQKIALAIAESHFAEWVEAASARAAEAPGAALRYSLAGASPTGNHAGCIAVLPRRYVELFELQSACSDGRIPQHGARSDLMN